MLSHPFIGRQTLTDFDHQVTLLTEEVELPPQLQEQLGRLQQLQQTLQAVMTQKQQLEIESSETDKAISELDKVTDQTPVYKSVGSLLVKSERQTLLAELKERKELLGTRITVLGRQEERTKERIKELQEKLQEKLRPTSSAN
jgi:prefoldin beta subunit